MIKKMKVLAVCGNFDDEGGRPSGYMSKLFSYLPQYFSDIRIINGGYYSGLPGMIDPRISGDYDVIFWFANVPNDKSKLLKTIKSRNPKCILVSSKNNSGDKYSFMHLMARALQSKSNLLLEVKKYEPPMEADGLDLDNYFCPHVKARVLDPLGNCYGGGFGSIISSVAEDLFKRVQELHDFTRVGSVKIGDAIEVPDEKDFFDLVKGYAEVFHTLMHTENQDRLLGNASFRCMRGMPSFRNGKHIFVSRRNIDKRYIGPEGFVAVEPSMDGPILGPGIVRYYGEHKPSVDTPIQLALYNYFPDINYIVHSHTYVEYKEGELGNRIETSTPIPCGAMEEFESIIRVKGPKGKDLTIGNDWGNTIVKLKGHGCLIMARDLSFFDKIKFVARTFPEAM